MAKQDSTGRLLLQVKEGEMSTVIQAIQEQFGGNVVGQRYSAERTFGSMAVERFFLGMAVEMTIYDMTLTKPLLIEREKDDDPDFIHIMVLTGGSYSQNIGGNFKTVGQSSNFGMFMYNGLLDMDIEIPPNVHFHGIGFKVKLSNLNGPYQEVQESIRTLFPKREEGTFYHHALSNEVLRLSADLFHFTSLKQYKELMVASRGIEILVHAITTFVSSYEGEELQMFHKDDLNRLQAIKDEILANIERRYSLEELAEKYNISASKLKRDFKKRYGLPVIQFANISRMEEAHRRLQSGKKSVSEVGYELGYSNLSKFTAMFKKMIGIMPSEVEVLE